MSNLEHPRITEVGRLLAERDKWREWQEAHDRVDHRAFALAQERDRLRQALERIAELNWLDDPHEARRIAKAALAKEAGK